MGVRIFAVGVLVLGIGAGLIAGYMHKTGDTLTVREDASTKLANPQVLDTPPADTNNPQALPPGARAAQVRQELAAQAKAKAAAQAKADAARKLAKARADRAANDRASRSKERGGPSGEQPPTVPTNCKTLTGNRQIGCSLLPWAGFANNQFTCLDKLFKRESGWNHKAHNKGSGAYGIPQALPGTKMAKYGADWKTNPTVQIKWGLNYIKGRYGTPCGAWAHSESVGWY
jgi:hypothetical protein